MCIESEEDLINLKRVGNVVAVAREEILEAVKPGITTAELDAVGEKVLKRFGARSAPKSEYNFPGSICISLNDVAAHGVPGPTVVQEGDLINVDVSAELNGFFADTGASMVVEPGPEIKRKLCEAAKAALYKGIASARPGRKLNRIGRAIHAEARRRGFTVLKNLTGHGIGRKLHEEPRYILNYYEAWDDDILDDGLVIAIESFVSTGAESADNDSDIWSLRTPDGSLVAQFEHTVVVSRGEPIILTAL